MLIMKYHRIRLALLGVCLLAPVACAPPPGDVPRSQAQIPALAPGMARVWLLRDNDPEEAEAGTPIIYANGQPIARSEPGAASYRICRRAPIDSRCSPSVVSPPATRTRFGWLRGRTPISRSNGDRAGRRANRADPPSTCGHCRRNWAKRISIRCAMSARIGSNRKTRARVRKPMRAAETRRFLASPGTRPVSRTARAAACLIGSLDRAPHSAG